MTKALIKINERLVYDIFEMNHKDLWPNKGATRFKIATLVWINKHI